MFFRLRQNHANNVVFLCILLITGGMILEIKVFYLKHQKHLRLEDYNKQMDAIIDTTSMVEKGAKRTSILLNRLTALIESRKDIIKPNNVN
ncbi:unnamed protein product [Phyllotreta striolata]|uniref:Uncharacterized protein n=1 Tax=Phyllotreta striolata TaxID=444603 RepID=A0A9N9XSA0_PHYSR|nr:unnamed protein product [Phyllotreta striolata]